MHGHWHGHGPGHGHGHARWGGSEAPATSSSAASRLLVVVHVNQVGLLTLTHLRLAKQRAYDYNEGQSTHGSVLHSDQ